MAHKPRNELDIELDQLEAWVPEMLVSTAESDQMNVFAGRAETIEDAAGSKDLPHVHSRIQKILSDNCMVPSDEGPCA